MPKTFKNKMVSGNPSLTLLKTDGERDLRLCHNDGQDSSLLVRDAVQSGKYFVGMHLPNDAA